MSEYVTTDVLLLADVLEIFRKICIEKQGLDLADYCFVLDLSCDALLIKTGAELELLTDQNMHLFIARVMRGGTSMVSKYYVKVNNHLVEGYDPVTQELLQRAVLLVGAYARGRRRRIRPTW